MKPFVFSVRGVYVAMFFDGSKLFEYRTHRPKVDTDDVVLIYETAPTKMVVASAVVGEIHDGTPAKIWALTGDAGGISKSVFDRYFHNRPRAVAMEWQVTRFAEPIPLPVGMASPQSWARWKGPWPLGNAPTPGRVSPP